MFFIFMVMGLASLHKDTDFCDYVKRTLGVLVINCLVLEFEIFYILFVLPLFWKHCLPKSVLYFSMTSLDCLFNGSVDIKILWWIHNRSIVHDKIFVIKLISNRWRGWLANEIKPRGNIKWRKLYGNVRRKDLYGKFLLNEIPN